MRQSPPPSCSFRLLVVLFFGVGVAVAVPVALAIVDRGHSPWIAMPIGAIAGGYSAWLAFLLGLRIISLLKRIA